jgi:hypothetical protein
MKSPMTLQVAVSPPAPPQLSTTVQSAIAGRSLWLIDSLTKPSRRRLTTSLSSGGYRRRQGPAPETDDLLRTRRHHGRRLTLRFRGNAAAGRAGYSVGAAQPHAQQGVLLGPGISHLHFSLPIDTVNSRSTRLGNLIRHQFNRRSAEREATSGSPSPTAVVFTATAIHDVVRPMP